ncbi:NADH-quinone oxidoreductase subunit L [Tautonia rosea]|uniref:NADH-quinone oxidoreductase subunit L n=1 Tax=Tautonia rosea TaxID=2728037 RepID=UPI0014761A24|nr:NADH-quinone oxidoreductase subunit L [Tautonia rosea]
MNQWQGWLYVASVLIPLVAFAIQIVASRGLRRWNAWVASGAIAASFLFSAIGFVSYFAETGGMLAPHHHGPSEDEGDGGDVDHAQVEASDARLIPIALRAEGEGGSNSAKVNGGSHDQKLAWTGEWTWIALGDRLSAEGRPLTVPMGVYVDQLTVIMFMMVTLIALLIHFYSMAYMAGDPRYPRFFAYLSLFCFSMLGLVAASNAFMVFIFWELVGICSYLLIGFWYEEKTNSNAANKAFITNRIGDVGMLLGLGLLWTQFGTFNIAEINAGLASVESRQLDGLGRITTRDPGEVVPVSVGGVERLVPYWVLVLAGLGVFAGCVGKSAQFPLHVWLPDAMAGPTPVSALIHAATMVAAGVYLVGRFFPLFTTEVLLIIAYTGGVTLFIAATIALVQVDYKKVLAYSTVSQLGFMMLALGVGGWAAGLFHLVTHAFFKALLFLGAGSVHHAVHTYDLRPLGGLRRKMPITATTMLLATLAISGVPLFSGFYSKDAILASAIHFVRAEPKHLLLLILPAVGAAMTAFYMFRMWFLIFTGEPRSESEGAGAERDPVAHAHESGPLITWPLRILAVPTVVIGWPLTILPLAMVGLPFHPVLENWLAYGEPLPAQPLGSAEVWAASTSLLVLVVGVGLAFLAYHPSKTIRRIDPARMARHFGGLYTLFVNKWYVDEIYGALVVNPVLSIARGLARFDQVVIDRIVNGLASAVVALSRWNRTIDRAVVDRFVMLVAQVLYFFGSVLRQVQTGKLRGYLMLLSFTFVVISVGIFIWISR